jgi:flavodoxin
MKVFVAYDSKYGNTKNVAEHILEGLKKAGVTETAIDYVKNVDLQMLAGYDALIIGAPNHMGKPSRTVIKFVNALPSTQLNARWVAVFDTYFHRQRYFEKAMRKLENHLNERLPNLKSLTPGLSIRVKGVNGPVVDGELPKAVAFGERIGIQLSAQSPRTSFQ